MNIEEFLKKHDMDSAIDCGSLIKIMWDSTIDRWIIYKAKSVTTNYHRITDYETLEQALIYVDKFKEGE